MSKTKFQTSDSLLRDVIERQSGNLEKGILELIQNGIDAGADEIRIDIGTDYVEVLNNGKIMDDEDLKSFTIFGESRKRGTNSIGEFGIGRGQIMPFGNCMWHSGKRKMYVNIHKFLGYQLRSSKVNFKGSRFFCVLYRKIGTWDRNYVLGNLKDMLLPNGINIYIDDGLVKPAITIFKETDKFDGFESSRIHGKIFANSLYVCSIPNSILDYNINVKVKPKLNFARNAFISGDEITTRLNTFVRECNTELLTNKKDRDIDNHEQIIRALARGAIELTDEIKEKKLIKSAGDIYYTFNELNGKKLFFSERNMYSDDLLRRGYYVVLTELSDYLAEIICEYPGLNYEVMDDDIKEFASIGYHREISIEKLTPAQKKNFAYALEMNKVLFLGKRNLLIGESDIAKAWTDGYSEVILNKFLLEKKSELLEVYRCLCHEYSHNDDTIEEDYHNTRFFEEFHSRIYNTISRMQGLLKTFTPANYKYKYPDLF